MRLSQTYSPLLANLGGLGGMPVSPTAVEKLGPDIMVKPALTGPFMIKSFSPGGEWVFVKNPSYWRQGRPYLDGITFVEIPDEQVRAASLQSGTIDLALFTEAAEATENLKKNPDLQYSQIPAGPISVSVNHALAPLDNLKVRQAVASCFDREVVLKTAFPGVAELAKGGILPPISWAFADLSDVQYKFDINKARDLLKESGLKTPVPLRLLVKTTSNGNLVLGQLLKGWLDDAGFQVALETAPSAEANRRHYDDGVTHMCITSAAVQADPDGVLAIYVTSSSYFNAGRKSQEPAQKQIDDLVKKGASIADQSERKKIYYDVQKLMVQNVMAHNAACYKYRFEAHRKYVKGTEGFWNNAWSHSRPQWLWRE